MDEFILTLAGAFVGSFIGVIVAIDLYYRMEGRRIMGRRWEFKWPNPRFWHRSTSDDTSTAAATLSGVPVTLSTTPATTGSMSSNVSWVDGTPSVTPTPDEFESPAPGFLADTDLPLHRMALDDLYDHGEDDVNVEWSDNARLPDEFNEWAEQGGPIDDPMVPVPDEFNDAPTPPAIPTPAYMEAAYGDAPPIDPDEFNDLAARLEAEADDPAAWEDDPAPDEFNPGPMDAAYYADPTPDMPDEFDAPTDPPYGIPHIDPLPTDPPADTDPPAPPAWLHVWHTYDVRCAQHNTPR